MKSTWRIEEEAASKATVMKQLRELQAHYQETQEDLEAEKEARVKAEKLRRDLNEVGLLQKVRRGLSLVSLDKSTRFSWEI